MITFSTGLKLFVAGLMLVLTGSVAAYYSHERNIDKSDTPIKPIATENRRPAGNSTQSSESNSPDSEITNNQTDKEDTGPANSVRRSIKRIVSSIISSIGISTTPPEQNDDTDNETEPVLPSGRYRNQVFDTITEAKNITFESTYETEIVVDQDGFKTLGFNNESPKDLKLNLYQPANDPMSKRPLLIFVYGGGWVVGDRNQQEAAAQYYAKRGYVTATIDYTMMPPDNEENPVMNPDDNPAYAVYRTIFYESSRDIYSAYEYLESHKDEYKIDTTKVGLAGWSAGGQISSTLAHISPLPTIPGLKAVLGTSSVLQGELLSEDPFEGYKTFNESYNPISMFASYDDDTGFAGQPNDHAADCEALDAIGHTCITVTFPGSGHDVEFHEDPVENHATDFFATYLAGV